VALPSAAMADELRISVDGIRSTEGSVVIGLYDSPATFARAMVPADGFLIDPARFGAVVLRANAALKSTVIFGNLDPGRYAVIAFHDENGNGELDRNFLDVPTEPYGFSNAAQPRFRPPTFDEAAITLAGGDSAIRITLVLP
jgi:uncharacterized protein (DUF2141 family)